ncbi:MAG: AbrB/MazE/SpoVT family DNA-binding domain-containing protein [Promethearchaeota archaeon]
MDRRKIQKVGKETYSISLPKSWVKRQGLTQGDYLHLSENSDGNLTIAPGPETRPATTEVIVYDQDFDRNLTTLYLRGIQEIVVKSAGSRVFDSGARRHMVEKARDLMGLEVVGEGSSEIKFRVVASLPHESVRDMVLRIFKLTFQMLKDINLVLSNWGKVNKDLLENVIARDREVNRWYFLVVRQIRNFFQEMTSSREVAGPGNPLVYLDYRIMSHNVEVVGDRCVGISRLLLDEGGKFGDHPRTRAALAHLANLVQGTYQSTLDAFLASDSGRAAEVILRKSDFLGEAQKLDSWLRMSANQKELGGVLLLAMEVFLKLRDIFEASIDLCDLIS